MCSEKFFCSEKFCLAVFPSAFQHLNLEKFFERSWNVFEESENSVVWMCVSEGVEDKAFFGYESISVSWNPASS